MQPIRYAITHDAGHIENYERLTHRILPEAGIPAPRGLRERAAQTGIAFPLLAFDGGQVVGGICPTVRDAAAPGLLLPEEEGTSSRLLGSHPLLGRRFVWANHLCIDRRYQGSRVLRELTVHLAALAKLFHAEAIGLICKETAVRLFELICEKYACVHGEVVDLAFDLPGHYRESGAVFFLIPTQGANVAEATLQRVREHCEHHGIRIPH